MIRRETNTTSEVVSAETWEQENPSDKGKMPIKSNCNAGKGVGAFAGLGRVLCCMSQTE